jgi:hypothetical protein
VCASPILNRKKTTNLSIDLSIYLSINLSIYRSIQCRVRLRVILVLSFLLVRVDVVCWRRLCKFLNCSLFKLFFWKNKTWPFLNKISQYAAISFWTKKRQIRHCVEWMRQTRQFSLAVCVCKGVGICGQRLTKRVRVECWKVKSGLGDLFRKF